MKRKSNKFTKNNFLYVHVCETYHARIDFIFPTYIQSFAWLLKQEKGSQ